MQEKRCGWCVGDELYEKYHDEEWGVPCTDDQLLYEFLILEGAQAGLSWITVLRKREAYRKAFSQFDPAKIARYSETQCEKLLQNPGIVRHRLKVNSAVRNARAFLEVQAEYGAFASFLWNYVDGKPRQNHWKTLAKIPASTVLSDQLSKDLKKKGFNFVGSTICYAYMQAVGLVNDHLVSCVQHKYCASLAKRFKVK